MATILEVDDWHFARPDQQPNSETALFVVVTARAWGILD